MRWFALLMLIVLSATGCPGSNSQETEPTGRIAFMRKRDYDSKGQLWVMRADGTGQRALTQGATPAWSPDGRRIAYSRDRDEYASDIFVIRFRHGGRLRLTATKYKYESQHSPVWSPDGHRIAFQGYDDGAWWISVVDADGSGEHQLTPPRHLEDAGPDWSPDGRTIAFTNVHEGAVYVMRPDGGGRHVLASVRGAEHACCVTWSPDGRRIAFLSDDDLWVMEADGTQPRRLVDSPGKESYEITWSPDGRRIAFSILERGPPLRIRHGDSEVHVVNADGSGFRNLTDSDQAYDDNPVWSPDGRAIAFTSDRDGNSEIYVMDADGSNERNVSQNPADDFDPTWSPND